MHSFVYCAPTKLYFGRDCLKNLGSEVKACGNRVLLVYGGGSIKKNGVYDALMAQLAGCSVWELSGVEPNPRVQSVNAGAALCREHDIEVVIAAGGGSAMDCSKAICAAAGYDGDAWDLVCGKVKFERALPLITVVTMAATGSEYDSGGVISNLETREKLGLVSPLLWPKVSFVDPSFTFTVPAWQTAAGACDIMSHYMEQYFTTGSNDIGDGFLETEIKAVIKHVKTALAQPDNYEARAHLSLAAAMGCSRAISLGNDPSVFVCHAIEHELSAYHDITHGMGLAVITPPVMEYILNEGSAPKLAQFARNVMGISGIDDDFAAARAGIKALREFFSSIGVPENLSAMGVDPANYEAMAEHACAFWPLQKAFVPLTADDVVNILHRCS